MRSKGHKQQNKISSNVRKIFTNLKLLKQETMQQLSKKQIRTKEYLQKESVTKPHQPCITKKTNRPPKFPNSKVWVMKK